MLRAQCGIAALALIGIFISDEKANYLLAFCALALATLWLWLANSMTNSRSHAERLRRTTLIAGGLGIRLDSDEAFELATNGTASDEEAARLIDPQYFASAKPPGPERLAEMLEESAIWTTTLARIAARETWFVFGGLTLITVLFLLSSVVMLDFARWVLLARISFVILMALLSVDLLGSAISYGEASSQARRIIDRARRFMASAGSLEKLIIIVTDYNGIVEAMPLFPEGLYDRHQKKLNEQYKLYLTGDR